MIQILNESFLKIINTNTKGQSHLSKPSTPKHCDKNSARQKQSKRNPASPDHNSTELISLRGTEKKKIEKREDPSPLTSKKKKNEKITTAAMDEPNDCNKNSQIMRSPITKRPKGQADLTNNLTSPRYYHKKNFPRNFDILLKSKTNDMCLSYTPKKIETKPEDNVNKEYDRIHMSELKDHYLTIGKNSQNKNNVIEMSNFVFNEIVSPANAKRFKFENPYKQINQLINMKAANIYNKDRDLSFIKNKTINKNFCANMTYDKDYSQLSANRKPVNSFRLMQNGKKSNNSSYVSNVELTDKIMNLKEIATARPYFNMTSSVRQSGVSHSFLNRTRSEAKLLRKIENELEG